MGGVAQWADYITNVLVALHVELFLLQEPWTTEPLRAAMSPMYRVAYGVHEGMGMGLAIGWHRALQVPNMVPVVVHDSSRTLQKEMLQQMSALAYVVRASLEVIGGDFNMAQHSGRKALLAALRPTGALGTYVPGFPPWTITNVT